jgi:hypothetical protein
MEMRSLLFAFAAAFVSQSAWAFPPPDFPNHGRPTPGAHETSPCSMSTGPREMLGRQVLIDRCNKLLAELKQAPDDQQLRARCDRAAKALTGRACEAPAKMGSSS